MSTKTGIQWTDHTFNIAWGCTKVSPGCANCYADRDATRYGFDVWGPGKERRTFGEKHWNDPRRWNRAAEDHGVRRRVFCSSMCDVFEDQPTIDSERGKLWQLVDDTPWLDWQILTKRGDRMRALVEHEWRNGPMPPRNVWLGVSVEDQATADERIPHLLATPAALRFLSVEPLLGPVDLRWCNWCGRFGWHDCDTSPEVGIDWVIVGGESGPNARPCRVEWIRSVLDQCKAAGVPVFTKQLGARPEWGCVNALGKWPEHVWFERHGDGHDRRWDEIHLRDRKGGDAREWPEDLRVREFPAAAEARA